MEKLPKGEPAYIGDKQIKGFERGEDETLVKFKGDNDDVTINNDLLELVMRPVENPGTVTDVVVHVLAAKYLAELADYGLEFYMVDHVAQGMKTFVHNLRETAIGKAFDCSTAMDVRLDKLID